MRVLLFVIFSFCTIVQAEASRKDLFATFSITEATNDLKDVQAINIIDIEKEPALILDNKIIPLNLISDGDDDCGSKYYSYYQSLSDQAVITVEFANHLYSICNTKPEHMFELDVTYQVPYGNESKIKSIGQLKPKEI